MNAIINAVAFPLVGWLADFYLLATLLLGLSFIGFRWIRQPVHRLAAAWIVIVELALLAIVCGLPGWPRISLVAQVPKEAPAAVPAFPMDIPLEVQEGLASDDQRVGSAVRTTDSPHDRAFSPAVAVGSGVRTTAPTFALPAWPILVGGVFLLGAALVGCWLLWGAAATIVLCRRATAAPPALFAQLAEIVRNTRAAPTAVEPADRQCGRLGRVAAGHPPALQLAQEGPPPSLRAVLLHEWAHIRNRDLWLLALGRFLLAILFAHPLYWWLRRKIRDDQELVADAMAAGESRPDYAEELLGWARLTTGLSPVRASAAVGLWEGPSQLTRRIATLLDETFCVQTAASRRWKYQAIGLLALLGLAGSLLTFQPARSAAQSAAPPIAATAHRKRSRTNLPTSRPQRRSIRRLDLPRPSRLPSRRPT